MKTLTIIAKVAILTMISLVISLSDSFGQEEVKKEKKITIKKEKIVDGKKVTYDTTFTIKEGESIKEFDNFFIKEGEHDGKKMIKVTAKSDGDAELVEDIMVWVSEDGDSIDIKSLHKDMDFDFDVDIDGDFMHGFVTDSGGVYKVIVKGDKGQKDVNVFMYSTDELEDIDEDMIWNIKGDGEHKVIVKKHGDGSAVWHSKDGDFVHKNVIVKEFDGEDMVIEINDEIIDLKHLDEAGNVMVLRSDNLDYHHGDHNVFFHKSCGIHLDDATASELKEVGISPKDKKLDIDHVYLFTDDEKYNLKFELKSEGKTTIKILNESGQTIFEDKVVYFPGVYQKAVGLNIKDKGTFYLHIVQGDASYSKKLQMK